MLSIASYFDESGKFKDHTVVSFGGVAVPADQQDAFHQEWERLLLLNGLEALTAKQALRHKYPLSDDNPVLGAEERAKAITPFISAIRKHFWIIKCVAVDVSAFSSLPSRYHQILGDDPFFTAFLRMLLEIIKSTHPEDKLMMVCDDEEQMAEPMYKLYRRVKIVYPEARDKLKSITFGDDEWMYALQAADLVSSLVRLEAAKRFSGTAYDYEGLFAEITKKPDSTEKICACGIGFLDRPMLENMAKNFPPKGKPNEQI